MKDHKDTSSVLKHVLAMITAVILCFFCTGCIDDHQLYEKYYASGNYRRALEILARRNMRMRRAGSEEIFMYPRYTRSTLMYGNVPAQPYGYHAYDFYDSGRLKTDIVYVRYLWSHRIYVSEVNEYYESGNLKMHYDAGRTVEYYDRAPLLDAGDPTIAFINARKPLQDIKLISDTFPAYERAVKKVREHVPAEQVLEYDAEGIMSSYNAYSDQAITPVYEKETDGDAITVRYGYRMDYGSSYEEWIWTLIYRNQRLTEQTREIKTDQEGRPPYLRSTWVFAYDENGMICSTGNTDGNTAQCQFSEDGRILYLETEGNAASYDYDENGRRIRIRLNDQTAEISYGETGKPVHITDGYYEYLWRYDEAGRLLEKEFRIDGSLNSIVRYVYE